MDTTPAEISDTPSDELEAIPPEFIRYQREKLITGILSGAINLGLLVPFAFFWGPALQSPLHSWLGDCPWLNLTAMAVVLGLCLEAVSIPFDFFSGYILEHRYKLSNQTLRGWLWKKFKSYCVAGVIGLPLLLGFYAFLWFTGTWWWVWAAVGWFVLSVVMARLLPLFILPLFYKLTPLEDTELQQRLEKLAEGTGLSCQGVYRWDLSRETRKANAALTGVGRSRRVLLSDTLLQEFSPEEIEVVFAHEVGHHVHGHLPQLLVWNGLIFTVSFWLIDLILPKLAETIGYSSFDAPAALPLVGLVLSLFGLVVTPLVNSLSRLFERQSDRYALQRTRLPQAYKSAFVKLCRLNKANPDPHPLVVWFFHDHPPLRERIALADK